MSVYQVEVSDVDKYLNLLSNVHVIFHPLSVTRKAKSGFGIRIIIKNEQKTSELVIYVRQPRGIRRFSTLDSAYTAMRKLFENKKVTYEIDDSYELGG